MPQKPRSFLQPTLLGSDLSDHEVERLVEVLTRAERNHREWLLRLNRELLCQGDFDDDILDERAHRHCRFGRWYYDEASAMVRGQEDFVALERLHAHMHDQARGLAQNVKLGHAVPPADYDRFAEQQAVFFDTLQRLRDHMRDSLAAFDSLTGARTRESFVQVMEAEAERVRRSGVPCSMALIDLDHFKQINDRHGHLVGDEVLQDVAALIRLNLRAYDGLCRYGGEEFLACLPETGLDEAASVMERLRQGVAAAKLTVKGVSEPLRATVSIGVAEMGPEGDVEATFHAADVALYRAKHAGRNQVILHRGGDDDPGTK
ncbi:MAG: diguanylate cyclase [Gammaproteobacteria bacterium]|nr:diguanylate cyclase [Gammaproteobacteria bacterium]MDX5375130.1 diguanylate cyclase [Gammaproteobacteria bacterium]